MLMQHLRRIVLHVEQMLYLFYHVLYQYPINHWQFFVVNVLMELKQNYQIDF